MKWMKKRKWIRLLSVALVAGILTVGCGAKKDASGEEKTGTEKSETAKTESDATEDKTAISGKHHVEINVKDYGTIKVELDADTAPITVENFMTLAEDGFYDGLTFHRIIDGFMMQGGDPNGNGAGGSDTKIKGEFEGNGVKNDISHVRGTISMARSSANDSASSQFFIVQSDSQYLDGEYAGFGTVTEGMEIVDQICKDTPVQDSNGTVAAEDQPVIESVKVID